MEKNKGGRPTKYEAEYDEQVYIYALRAPCGAIRYVGKTGDPKKRLEGHAYPNRRNITPVARWCRKLKKAGGVPAMEILEEVPASSWEDAERRWIARLKEDGCDLLNVSGGGLEMKHVQKHARRYPAYTWIMRFCARTGRRELADGIRKRAGEIEREYGRGGRTQYDEHLRAIVLEVRPLTRIA